MSVLSPLVLAIALQASAADSIAAARVAAQKGDLAGAARAYEEAAGLLPACTDLEYDTGTAAAQAGQVGTAVLHLERALRASPWDSEIRQNLERVRQKRIDKVLGQEPGESPVQRLAFGLPGPLLFWGSLLAWWAGFAALVLRVLRRRRGGAGPAAALALAVVMGAGFLAWHAERGIAYGVVLVPGSEGEKVRSGPAADLPSSFEVHDGLKVLMLGTENGFTHIRLGNGLEGYLPEGEVQEI